jgi:DNA primase
MFLDVMVSNLHQSIFRYPEVLRYLESRQVTQEDIKKYGLGFNKILHVPEEQSKDRERFMAETYKGKKFEGKIIFPFRDMLGNIVGIAGRSIDVKDYKLWATDRAKHDGFFFGLHEALPFVYEENKVFTVEGTFDCIALAKAFPNTVGTLTSGINDVQYGLLRMFCNTIITVFDSDSAGRHGTEKAEERSGVVSVNLGYKDPAKALETLGVPGFKKYALKKINDTVPLFLK